MTPQEREKAIADMRWHINETQRLGEEISADLKSEFDDQRPQLRLIDCESA